MWIQPWTCDHLHPERSCCIVFSVPLWFWSLFPVGHEFQDDCFKMTVLLLRSLLSLFRRGSLDLCWGFSELLGSVGHCFSSNLQHFGLYFLKPFCFSLFLWGFPGVPLLALLRLPCGSLSLYLFFCNHFLFCSRLGNLYWCVFRFSVILPVQWSFTLLTYLQLWDFCLGLFFFLNHC